LIDIVLDVQARGREHRFLRVLDDHVDHVVDGDPADEPAVRVDDGCRDQVVLREDAGYLGVRQVERNGLRLGVHHLPHDHRRVGGQQRGEGQNADVLVVVVGDHQRVRGLRQLFLEPEVAKHDLHGVTRPHGDGIRVHQPARRVLGERQDGFEPGAIAGIEGGQHLGGNRLRELLKQVGEVVGVELRTGRNQRFRVHVLEKLGLDVVVQVLHDLTVLIGVEELPEHAADLGRGGLQQHGQLGRAHGFQEETGFVDQTAAVQADGALDLFLNLHLKSQPAFRDGTVSGHRRRQGYQNWL